MSGKDTLGDAGNIAPLSSVVLKAWQSLPEGDPNLLYQIIDPVGVTFVNSDDATHHGGVDFDNLFQLHQTAHNAV